MKVSQQSNIEWCDASWNTIHGCTRVSPGCQNCYAERMSARFSKPGEHFAGVAEMTPQGPRWTRKITLRGDKTDDPLHWRKPRMIFVNSMSDTFHKDVPDEFISSMFGVMSMAPRHTFQLLTKRPERAVEVLQRIAPRHTAPDGSGWPLRNVWIGTSVESQQYADERIPHLLNVPAAVRFLSCEPLLGPVDLAQWLSPDILPINDLARACGFFRGGIQTNNGYGCTHPEQEEQEDGEGLCHTHSCPLAVELNPDEPEDVAILQQDGLFGDEQDWMKPYSGIRWVITGAESGPGARPMNEDWVRSLRDQCVSAGTKFFYKQRLDEKGHKVSLPELDGRVWAEMPEVAHAST